MKQGTPVITVVMVAIAAAMVVYFGYYVFDTFNDPFTTTLAYSYTVSNSVEADGMLVRDEVVLPAQSGIVDVTRGEGEKVAAGKQVALVYRDTQAQADQAQLDQLALEIQLLEQAAVGSGSVESAAKLDEEILQSVVELRSSVALGDFNQLEDQVLAVKSGVLKRGYTYGDGLTAESLTQRLSELKSQYSALRTQTSTATTRVTAPQAGTFSNLVDGYEELLTPQTVFQLTPSSLEELMGRSVSGGGLGKLILGYYWYFAAALPQEVADTLIEGSTVTMRFTGDFNQDVDMQVEQVGAPEEGECLVVFSSDEYLSQTTLLRRQTAELVFESWSGLRIPKEALRLEKVTYTDPDTSQEQESTRLGVYVLVGGRTEFKEVKVVTEGADYYVVEAADHSSSALRAGDEVIVEGVGLYDGQLLEF
ncbi:HlyD family efflux transporter periplasmic adaptor subunit [Flavonifractor sp. An100]|uniref:HlyD family efflux transporter periplasmic adaptor subunit n=1 Tax=Flavonifractor sp. An100 TaxID=1965538 RepID=UPI000B394EC6|nr:HlyD family efflux transporter periplasmic adaptor subunit [Flavonifractor sp. An100]OUQ78795.1 hypothetical protein B5E43_07655 [Flavonifractor sp. An100]